MWLGSHYGGSSLAVASGEDWTKVVGPFAIYCNSARGHEALWKDALARAKSESERWPYNWLNDSNYPNASQRSGVDGQIGLRDPFEPKFKLENLWVGLTAADYVPPRTGSDLAVATSPMRQQHRQTLRVAHFVGAFRPK